jgi:hypothetical protein
MPILFLIVLKNLFLIVIMVSDMQWDNKITVIIIFILCYANGTPLSTVASEIGLKIDMRNPRRSKLLV